ncbi:MAG TPA: SpoIIE family protein phosphatase [Acidimicrobiales bacterium]|nr:SpoIIE family protein phosphatase [Acidimicrobiales bacterium]
MVALTELRLEAGPEAVGRARSHVRASLATAPPGVVEDAALVASELVTNAVLHGEPPVVLRVRPGPPARVEVHDAGRSAPIVVGADADAMTGRGLAMVRALTGRFGVDRLPAGGKVVWAELGYDGHDDPAPAVGAAEAEVDVDALLAAWADDDVVDQTRYTVRLGAVSTELLLAAKAHIDNLVRELVLVGEGAGDTELAPELAELIRSVRVDFAEARASIKRQAAAASARGAALTDLELHLPASAAAAGERYLAALDHADRYARSAHLLTLAPPPTHRVFRRWYIGSLVEQLRALRDGREPPAPRAFQSVLSDEVGRLASAAEASTRLALLQDVARQLADIHDAAVMARVVVDRAVEVLGVESARVRLVDADRMLRSVAAAGPLAAAGVGYDDYPLDSEVAGAVAVRTATPVVLPDLAARFRDSRLLRSPYPSGHTAYAAPLVVGDAAFGLLTVVVATGEMTTESELALVVSLADVLAQAIKRVELAVSDAETRSSLRLLADATELLIGPDDPDEVLERLAALAVPRLGDWCTVYIGAGDHLRRAAVAVDGNPDLAARMRAMPLPLDLDVPQTRVFRTGVAEWVATPLRPIVRSIYPGVDPAAIGDLDRASGAAAPIELRGERIGVIALTFLGGRAASPAVLDTLAGLGARAAIAYDTARRASHQRQVLDTLVRALLPDPAPTVPGYRLAVRHLAAGEAAGDWWEADTLRDGSVLVGIGDAAGHGIAAVSRMAQLRQGARALAAVTADPAELLELLDRGFDGFATALYGRLDPSTGTLTWASAGHVPPLLARADGTVDVLPGATRPALGAPGDWRAAPRRTALGPGDTLVLTTDGVVERRGESIDDGLARLRTSLTAAAGLTVDELADRLVSDHCGDRADDCCLLVVRRGG